MKRKRRKGKMPAALRAYWAKRRAPKRRAKRRAPKRRRRAPRARQLQQPIYIVMN